MRSSGNPGIGAPTLEHHKSKAFVMTFIKIDKASWTGGLDAARKQYRLFGPVKEGDFHNFKALADGQAPDLDCRNTRMSPRSVVYPQSEVLFEYSLDDSQPDAHIMKEPQRDETPRAAVALRPCDAYAFILVRRNFDTPEHKDVYWLRNYEATTFVGLACNDPCGTCFCTSAGSGPCDEQGLDVLLFDEGDHYLAKVITEKGATFLKAAGWQAEAEADAADRIQALKRDAEAKIATQVATDRLAGQPQLALYNAPFWDDIAFSCINCGTCTYLCPTCWCFDIQDENRGRQGLRMRNWDSCMAPLFTLHGSGHNPRGEKVQRVRQRFMHKLKYYVDKYGDGIQCVGCGRCVTYCPVNIDIRKVCDLMNGFGENTACSVAS